MEKVFLIEDDGRIVTLYDDAFAELGAHKVCRASSVEFNNVDQQWHVELSDCQPRAGFAGLEIGNGFKTRQEALDAEVKFIQETILK